MRAGRGAAVGVITEGVDVHAALGVGIVASDVPGDGGGSRLGGLLEDDGTRDLGVTTDDADCSLPHQQLCDREGKLGHVKVTWTRSLIRSRQSSRPTRVPRGGWPSRWINEAGVGGCRPCNVLNPAQRGAS